MKSIVRVKKLLVIYIDSWAGASQSIISDLL